MAKYRPKTKPFPHQSRATLRAVRRKNLAFFMEPRTGKTKAVIDATAIQALKERVRRVLVVCPLSALSVWEDELDEHMPLLYKYRQAEDTKWYGDANPQLYFFLINYDKFRQRTRPKKRWVYEWAKAIEEWQPDLIILDESHRAKRPGAVTSQTLWRSVERMRKKRGDGQPFVYIMTGTPNPNGYRDIFAQFRIMDESIFGTDVASFDEVFCNMGFGTRRHKVVSYNHKDILKQKIRENSYIISRARAFPDAEPELPPVSVKIHIPRKARRLYDELVQEGLAFLEGGEVIEGLTPGVLRLRLQQITGGFTTDGVELHDAKLKMAKDILRDLHELHESIIVYCRLLPEVHAVHREAKALGFRSYEIHGGVRDSDRTLARKSLEATRADPKGQRPVCLVYQVSTGSLAIDLSAAGEVLFYSLPDSFVDYWQAVSRVHGPKQTRAVRVRHLLGVGTVDIRQLAGLRDKADLHAELMGNPRGFLLGSPSRR